MDALVDQVLQHDVAALEAIESLRWAPLTGLFVLASAAWVKGPLLIALAAARDLRERVWLSAAAACGAIALLLGSAASTLLKDLVERSRPATADPSISAAVATPDSPSFPSGHTTGVFAAAVAIALIQPRLRVPMLAIAGMVGLSRVYLGVHFVTDVVAGVLIGGAIGATAAIAWRASSRALSRPAPATS